LPIDHAFVWENGRLTDLGTLRGGVSRGAVAINDEGQIVGTGTNARMQKFAVVWARVTGCALEYPRSNRYQSL
jgi:uncharacterized membrane protein